MTDHEHIEIDTRRDAPATIPTAPTISPIPTSVYSVDALDFLENGIELTELANRRFSEPSTSESPSFRCHPKYVLNGIYWWLRLELIECTFHFIFATWYMFFCLRMPISEIRERVTGWLTLTVALSGGRCILVTMMIEELKWLRSVQGQFDIRIPLITLLQSSKMAMSRWLHILDILWWCISYQLLSLYSKYVELMKPLRNGQDMLPQAFLLARTGGRPLLTFDRVEEQAIAILSVVARVSMYSLAFYCIVVTVYSAFFLAKAVTPIGRWIHYLTPANLEPLPSMTSPQTRQSVPLNCLYSFPTLRWSNSWRVRSEEALKHSTASCLCLVCLQSYQDEELLRVLPCGHAFHAVCIDEWLSSHIVCPMRCDTVLTVPFRGVVKSAILEKSLPPLAIDQLNYDNESEEAG